MFDHANRNIDIALLRAFVAAAETGSMTLAAQMLNRTQGAVSQQIARLEALFDASLFDRRPEGLRPTTAGERLLVGAHRMIAENDALMATMMGVEAEGEIRLGVPPDVVGVLIPPALRLFRERHPNARVTLVSEGTRALREAIARERVDLAITTDAVPAEDASPLMTDELVWTGAPDGSAYKTNPLPVALGEETCAFRASAVNALVTAGIDWRPVLQIGSLEPVIATLNADAAIAVFLSRTIPEGLDQVGRKTLPKLPTAYVNLTTPRNQPSDLVADLISCLRDTSNRLIAA
ncbi:MAG: LysR family transcriptional regulator [Pseudomonadota bacterium]